jgi:phage anti-repressor protein
MEMSIVNVNDDLVNLIREKMNTEEENLFVESFKTYLKYGDDDTAFIIDLDDIWEWVGFNTKGNAKRVILKNFEDTIDYKILLISVDKQYLHGGHNKETILLSVNTFKEFCILANTEKAKVVRKYYLKMENVMHKYIQNKIKNLSDENNKLQLDMIEHTKIEKHNSLLRVFATKHIVYLMLIKILDKKRFVIKVGYSDDLNKRLETLNGLYKIKIYLLDCFECQQNIKFEDHMKRKATILINNKYTDIIGNNNTSTECYVMNDENHYKQVVRYMQSNVIYFKGKSLEELKEERKIKEIESYNKRYEIINKLIDSSNTDDDRNKIIKLLDSNHNIKKSNTDSDNNINLNNDNDLSSDDKSYYNLNNNETLINATPHKLNGPYIQIYDKNDIKKLIKSYETYKDAIREILGASETSIKKAAIKHTEYCGYRWYLFNKTENSTKDDFHDIGETKKKKIRAEKIAMLNLDKTEVLQVFARKLQAAEYLGLASTNPIKKAMDNNVSYNKYNFIFWYDLSIDMRNKYEHLNTDIQKPNHPKQKEVCKVNAVTNEIIEKFNSMQDVYVKYHISNKTLKKYILEDSLCNNGFKWKLI